MSTSSTQSTSFQPYALFIRELISEVGKLGHKDSQVESLQKILILLEQREFFNPLTQERELRSIKHRVVDVLKTLHESVTVSITQGSNAPFVQSLSENNGQEITTLEATFRSLPPVFENIFSVSKIARKALFITTMPVIVYDVCESLIEKNEVPKALDMTKKGETPFSSGKPPLTINICTTMVRQGDYETPIKIALSILNTEERDSVLLEITRSLKISADIYFFEALHLISDPKIRNEAITILKEERGVQKPTKADPLIGSYAHVSGYVKNITKFPTDGTASSIFERAQIIKNLFLETGPFESVPFDPNLLEEDFLRESFSNFLIEGKPEEALKLTTNIENPYLRNNLVEAHFSHLLQQENVEDCHIERTLEKTSLISDEFISGRVFFSVCMALLKKGKVDQALFFKEKICQNHLREKVIKEAAIKLAEINKQEALTLAKEIQDSTLYSYAIKGIYYAIIKEENAEAISQEVLLIDDQAVKSASLEAIFQKLLSIKSFDKAKMVTSHFTNSPGMPFKGQALTQIFAQQILCEKYEEALLLLEEIEKEFGSIPADVQHLRFKALIKIKPFSEVVSLFETLQEHLLKIGKRNIVLKEIYTVLLEDNRLKDYLSLQGTVSKLLISVTK